MPCHTFINGNTGEIITWYQFYIPREEINEFNKVVKEYTDLGNPVPDTFKLVSICFKDEHLRVPTIEELKLYPYTFIDKAEKKELPISKYRKLINWLIKK